MTDIVSAGDFRPVPAKLCRCGNRGEWPGRLCPRCKTAATRRVINAAGELADSSEGT